MTQQNPILEYSAVGLPIPNGRRIRLYQDGRVEIIGIGYDFKKRESIDGKILRELMIQPEQVLSFAERLVQAGFFEFKDKYMSFMFDGLHESITLNYQEKSKTVKFENQSPPSNVNSVIKELEELVNQ